MRIAIDTVMALRLHHQERLAHLTIPAEINEATKLVATFLASSCTDRSTAPPNEPIAEHSGPLKDWVTALVEIEHLESLPGMGFEAVLGAALRAIAFALQGPTDIKSGNDLLNIAEAAARANVSRPTIYDWLAKKRLIGWERGSKQGWLIPARQIVGPGRIADGIPEVLEVLGDLAWDFLSTPRPFADGTAMPIDKLTEGGDAVQEVLTATRHYLVNVACDSFLGSQPLKPNLSAGPTD